MIQKNREIIRFAGLCIIIGSFFTDAPLINTLADIVMVGILAEWAFNTFKRIR